MIFNNLKMKQQLTTLKKKIKLLENKNKKLKNNNDFLTKDNECLKNYGLQYFQTILLQRKFIKKWKQIIKSKKDYNNNKYKDLFKTLDDMLKVDN